MIKQRMTELVLSGTKRELTLDESEEFLSYFVMVYDKDGKSIELQLGIEIGVWIDFVLFNTNLVDKVHGYDRHNGRFLGVSITPEFAHLGQDEGDSSQS